MSYPTTFANLTAGNQNLSLFDTMFNVVGQQGNIPCTASGTNAITLTPSTNYYNPAAYTIAQIASFKAVATSTGAMTLKIGSLASLKLFTAAGVQANSGDVVINTHYEVQYWADLDTGTGGFIILNASVTAIANPVKGTYSNLKITNGGTPSSQAAVTADAVVMQNASGGTARATSISLTISTATTGANALDTGTVAASTWYFIYAIYNSASSTVAGLFSTSSTTPTLPSGYTYYARLGAMQTDGSNNFYRTLQYGRTAQYVVTGSTNTLTPFPLGNGVAGSWSTTSPTLTGVQVTGNGKAAPTTASGIMVFAVNTWKAGTLSNVIVAPSTSYGGTNNGPTGSAGQIYPIWLDSGIGASMEAEMVLESNSIAWSSSAAGGAIAALGWVDNL